MNVVSVLKWDFAKQTFFGKTQAGDDVTIPVQAFQTMLDLFVGQTSLEPCTEQPANGVEIAATATTLNFSFHLPNGSIMNYQVETPSTSAMTLEVASKMQEIVRSLFRLQ